MMEVYGIGNCDTCRKARKWLEKSGYDYRWHDLRADGIDAPMLVNWIDSLGLDALVNRRSTTWRGLDEAERQLAMGIDTAPALLASYPTLIKRPVFDLGERVLVGFNDSVKHAL